MDRKCMRRKHLRFSSTAFTFRTAHLLSRPVIPLIVIVSKIYFASKNGCIKGRYGFDYRSCKCGHMWKGSSCWPITDHAEVTTPSNGSLKLAFFYPLWRARKCPGACLKYVGVILRMKKSVFLVKLTVNGCNTLCWKSLEKLHSLILKELP